MAWRVFAGAATGASHLESGLPCQDAFHHVVRGELLVAAVCDGAGSQPRSDEGARTVAHTVVETLAAALAERVALPALDAAAFATLVASAVADARATLAALAGDGQPIDVFACTLVGAVAAADGGYFFHIGDGIGVADPLAADAAAWLSLPENGEYANETYFVSGEHWRAHLRVLAIGPAQRIALMSDGAASFVMAKGGAGLFRAFTDPVERFLLGVADPAQADAALAATLADPRTHSITGDDKALLLALRS